MFNYLKSFEEYFNCFISSILAGLCISIGCIVNLTIGGIAGAILFTFGLLTVVHYGYFLYTGTSGFVETFKGFLTLIFIILLGNFVGCYLTSLLTIEGLPDLIAKSNIIIESRANYNIWQALIRGGFCGFLMTTAVTFGKQKLFLPLLFAVPLFILSGFWHSIADAFYLFTSNYNLITGNINDSLTQQINMNWGMTIIGNFIGCNLYRIKRD